MWEQSHHFHAQMDNFVGFVIVGFVNSLIDAPRKVLSGGALDNI